MILGDIMAIKDQWKKIKDNWLIIIVVLALFLFMNLGGVQNLSYSTKGLVSQGIGDESYDSIGYNGARSSIVSPTTDFAPDVTERKITKSASLSTEVERGQFDTAQKSLKGMISSSDSYILTENVNKYGTDRKEYYQGSYDMRVDTTKYDALISQLKSIGEVQSFSESAKDVTGQYTNAEINLGIEKARLQRYQEMYAEAKDVKDKLDINDRIFDQERTIKYLEDSIKNIDERVDYTTIRFSLTEKRSGYADVVLVKFSSLIENLVDSFNSLLVFIFTVIPWAILFFIVLFVWKLVKKKIK
jgi:Tfp pilus tip-associated adhesin PilY1